MHKVRGNYRNGTCRSTENICSRIRGKRKEGIKTGRNSVWHKNGAFLSFSPRWRLMYFFAGFFWISPGFGANPGFWSCVFLTLRISQTSGKSTFAKFSLVGLLNWGSTQKLTSEFFSRVRMSISMFFFLKIFNFFNQNFWEN